jgi:hypothetical protein
LPAPLGPDITTGRGPFGAGLGTAAAAAASAAAVASGTKRGGLPPPQNVRWCALNWFRERGGSLRLAPLLPDVIWAERLFLVAAAAGAAAVREGRMRR